MSDMPTQRTPGDAAAADENRAAVTDEAETATVGEDTAGRAETSSLAVAVSGERQREESVAVNLSGLRRLAMRMK